MSNKIALLDKEYLKSNILLDQLEEAIPKNMDIDRFMRILYNAVQSTPKLFECTRHSFYNALMQSTMLGLEPNTPQGLAYLIPYKSKCTFQVGYKGLIHITRRSGLIKHVNAQLVFKKDEFSVSLGTEYRINHIPAFRDNPNTREEYLRDVSHAYSVVTFKDGSFEFCVMGISEVEKIRLKCAPSGSEAWFKWYGEMVKKTVYKRLLKTITLEEEAGTSLSNAIEVDGLNEAGKPVDITNYVEMTDEAREVYLREKEKEQDKEANRDRASFKINDITPKKEDLKPGENKKDLSTPVSENKADPKTHYTVKQKMAQKPPASENKQSGLTPDEEAVAAFFKESPQELWVDQSETMPTEPVNLNPDQGMEIPGVIEETKESSGSLGFDKYQDEMIALKRDLQERYTLLSSPQKISIIRVLYPEDLQRRRLVVGSLNRRELDKLQVLIDDQDQGNSHIPTGNPHLGEF